MFHPAAVFRAKLLSKRPSREILLVKITRTYWLQTMQPPKTARFGEKSVRYGGIMEPYSLVGDFVLSKKTIQMPDP
ncbi:hypothetical protein [Pontiella desulfatans]|jgi:hypothetical protein|uniref:hypothetical protein n=1 Tax=Pontiella desulfatans TaxID=2750659 RepID=UPI00109CA70A|nr:hypothetical protein [Pontiella desulfatans]